MRTPGAGKLEAAETAFVEGIATSEQMGLVREMLAMITKVARIARGHRRRTRSRRDTGDHSCRALERRTPHRYVREHDDCRSCFRGDGRSAEGTGPRRVLVGPCSRNIETLRRGCQRADRKPGYATTRVSQLDPFFQFLPAPLQIRLDERSQVTVQHAHDVAHLEVGP